MMQVKKPKAQKCAVKRKIRFEDHERCLEAIQLENKTNYLEKNNLNVVNPQESHREFITKL